MNNMLRAVIDTNVIVSALISPKGNASTILNMIADNRLTPVYSNKIFSEYQTVLIRPRFGFSKTLIDDVLSLLVIYGLLVNPQTSGIPLPDESDRIFYDVTVESGSLLITGNIRHFPLAPYILLPSDFLKKYQ